MKDDVMAYLHMMKHNNNRQVEACDLELMALLDQRTSTGDNLENEMQSVIEQKRRCIATVEHITKCIGWLNGVEMPTRKAVDNAA